MVRNSRFKLKEDTSDKLLDLFFEVLVRNNTKNSFKRIIFDLFSKEERVMVSKRVAITYLLLKEIDYRTICSVLKVSQATVAKFSLLIEKSDGLVLALRKILRKEKVARFFEKVFLELYPPGTPYMNWESAWRRKLNYEKKRALGL